MTDNAIDTLARLQKFLYDRKSADPNKSYVAQLYNKGRGKIAEKVGEEAIELVIEAIRDDKDAIKAEAADLLFHLMILLADSGLSIEDVTAVLEQREGLSGLTEKAAREQ